MNTMNSKLFLCDDQRWNFNPEDQVKSRILAWSDRLMLMEWTFSRKGTVLPLHRHPHEQITTIIKGSADVTLADGSVRSCHAGDALVFAPDEIHGLLITEDDTVAIDVFSPMREDHLAHHLQNEAGEQVFSA